MNKRLFWLALGTFAIGAEGFVISSLLPQISEDTGVTLVEAGYLVVAFALVYAVGAPVLTAITADRDRRTVLTLSALVFAAGAIMAALAQSYGILLAARMIIACAAGLYAATAQATAVAISHVDHRARAIAIVVGGTSLAVALGAPLGAFVAALAGWRGTYVSIAAAGVIAALAIHVMLPGGLRGTKVPLRERFAVLARPGIPPLLATTLVYMTAGFMVFTYIAPMTIQAAGLDRSLLPTVLLLFGTGAALGNYLGGQLADRWGAQRTVTTAIVLNTLMMLFFALVGHLPAAWAGPAFLGALFPWGVMAWSFPPAQASRILAVAPDSAPLALSLNASALYFGVALGSFVGGLVLRYAGATDLGWIAALFMLSGLVLLGSRRTRRVDLPAIGSPLRSRKQPAGL